MFRHQNKTNFPPSEKPVFVWDGNCGFCHYWIIRWKKMSGEKIYYAPFQKEAKNFPDVPLERFIEAVRLIEIDGKITSGPEAAYRSLFIIEKQKWLYRFYLKSKNFRNLSDYLYNLVAQNRELFFKITKSLFGKNPRKMKHYWLYYILFLIIVILLGLS